MKKFFKLGFLALAIAMTVAACSSNKTTESTVDSDSLRAADSMMMAAPDTMAVDSMAADTTK
jgi:hypothetical protein